MPGDSHASSQHGWDLAAEQAERRAQGLWRRLPERPAAAEGIFCSNDYLGLAASAELREAVIEGARRHGAGATGSRLISGSWAPHRELEEKLALFKGTEAALTFSSGYATAVGTIPALAGKGDTLILDKLCHASLVDAARLSGATLRVFPHNHLGKLEKLLAGAKGRVLVVTESIFSMDGDAAPLREIVELKDRHGAWLLVDEAHGVGVLGAQGRGLGAALGVERRIDLHLGTLSKACGLSGGYLAAARAVVDHVLNHARSFIYSTAPLPAVAHAAGVAVDLVAGGGGDERRRRLLSNVALAESLFPGRICQPAAAILPLVIGDETVAMDLSARLKEAGFFVPAVRYPTVARGAARLRVTLSALHEPAQISALARALLREAGA